MSKYYEPKISICGTTITTNPCRKSLFAGDGHECCLYVLDSVENGDVQLRGAL